MNRKIAIIGAGASGCICACWLLKSGLEVTLFDKNLPLRTLLPTGGGRCNLAHAEYDFKELVKNYPRGEKFLYSVFSKFSTAETIEMFEKFGIKTYTQDDGRIFPESNSSKDVQEKILHEIRKLGVKFVQSNISAVQKSSDGFRIIAVPSPQPSPYGEGVSFSHVVIATGGHSGYELLKPYGINIIEPKPSLVGLNTKEDFKELSGVVVKTADISGFSGDILFTHFGVSGPLIYKISSINAFKQMPYKLKVDLYPNLTNLQEQLNIYPHKEIKNLLAQYLPQKVVKYLLGDIDETTRACNINAKTRDLILKRIHNFEITITGANRGEETVTAGGVDLDEINPKTMEVKKVPNLYCIGEVLNIDGFCGGFNLQNAWSTAYVCAEGIIKGCPLTQPSPAGRG